MGNKLGYGDLTLTLGAREYKKELVLKDVKNPKSYARVFSEYTTNKSS